MQQTQAKDVTHTHAHSYTYTLIRTHTHTQCAHSIEKLDNKMVFYGVFLNLIYGSLIFFQNKYGCKMIKIFGIFFFDEDAAPTDKFFELTHIRKRV